MTEHNGISYENVVLVFSKDLYNDSRAICYLVRSLKLDNNKPVLLVAPGGGTLFEKTMVLSAKLLDKPIAVYPPKWKTHQKGALIRRNQELARICTHAVVIYDEKDKPSRHMLRQLLLRGRPFTTLNLQTESISHERLNPNPQIVDEVDGYSGLAPRHPVRNYYIYQSRTGDNNRFGPAILPTHFGKIPPKRQADDWQRVDEPLA